MRNGIIVCRLSLIKTYLLAFHVLRKYRESAPLKTSLVILGFVISGFPHTQTFVTEEECVTRRPQERLRSRLDFTVMENKLSSVAPSIETMAVALSSDSLGCGVNAIHVYTPASSKLTSDICNSFRPSSH